jgi:phosphopantothenoylcysteine decarboxylase
MAKVLLGVTGSVAAIRTPQLFQSLRSAGHEVKVVATTSSLYFFDPALLSPADPTRAKRNPEVVFLDEDEWPGRSAGQRYRRDDPVIHIELRRWAEVFLIAPLDANTLAKLANGLADNCLTCAWRAWDPARPVLLAPAMNTLMWEHPLTELHLRQLARLMGAGDLPGRLDLESLLAVINQSCPTLRIIPPQSKRLACGDIGMGALAEIDRIVEGVASVIETRRH